jgi:small subunit ribosomal protein S17
MSEVAAMSETTRGRRRTLIGTVVSVKMDKTAVVSVERRRPHPLYRKIVRTTKRYKAHDPLNACVLGDVVRIEETRPISKDKHWRVAATLTRGNVADLQPNEIAVPQEMILTPQAPAAPASQPAAEAEATPVAETEASPAAAVPEGGAEPSGPDIAAEATAAEAEEATEAEEGKDA